MSLHIKSSHYFIGAVALVTALSWNSLVKNGINKYFPIPRDELAAEFIYAITITMILIFLIWLLPDTTSELPIPIQEKLKGIRN